MVKVCPETDGIQNLSRVKLTYEITLSEVLSIFEENTNSLHQFTSVNGKLKLPSKGEGEMLPESARFLSQIQNIGPSTVLL